jgi:hypothetical protein
MVLHPHDKPRPHGIVRPHKVLRHTPLNGSTILPVRMASHDVGPQRAIHRIIE